MNKKNSKEASENEARAHPEHALPGTAQAGKDARVLGHDGWIITVQEHDVAQGSGMTMARRFELVATPGAEGAQGQSVTLYCSAEELAGFRLACAEAARAELEITNPLAGLRHYRTATLAFPFLPGLDALRDRLMASAGNMVEASLNTAGECMKQRRTWPAARPALERVKALIEIEDALHVAYGARYTLLMSLVERLERLAQHRLAADEAHDLLRGLHDELAGDPESVWHLPGWRSVRDRLKRLDTASRLMTQEALFDARRQFIADANRACHDASASRFLEHFQADELPADEDIAQLQLDEAERLLRRADEVLRRHEAAEIEDAGESMSDAIAMLHAEISKLEGWQRDLHALLNALNIARHHAALGLREPAHFDVARYVLSIGGRKPTAPLRQVPAMFVGHPSLLHCKAYAEECAARRASQERLLREITLCLQWDTVTQPAQLPAQGDDFIHALRSRLQTDPPAYPIEMALEKLRLMKREEPADACGLQKDLRYVDNDDHRREHASLPAIEAVVERKVNQIHALRDWLMTFRRAGVDFPGVVDWADERQHIEALRDSGPAGLPEAQAHCRRVKAGDADGTVNGLWPLARMCSALSKDNMLAHLQQVLGETNAMPLCAAARAINEQRHEMWLACERSLHECDALLKDIASRIERYPAAWDAFEMAHRALMTVPVWRRRRIAYSAEWQDFQHAAEAFNGICPNYNAFRARLHDVKARFHLVPAFLHEHDGHEIQHA